jgi:hypothetical protein
MAQTPGILARFVWVPPNNRARLEQRCRYLLRPPLAQDRIRLRADGRVLIELKTVWRDGTSHFLCEPIEFLEKLAALIPRPAVTLFLYHGVLAPCARWRSQVVRYGRPAPDGNALEASPRAAAGAIMYSAYPPSKSTPVILRLTHIVEPASPRQLLAPQTCSCLLPRRSN